MVKFFLLIFFSIFQVNGVIAEEKSAIDKLLNGDRYGFSKFGMTTSMGVNFPTRDDVSKNTESGLIFVEADKDVTLADFSMGMNCKTGAININGSLPDLNNFGDAMKVLAPFAVNEKGEVDFTNFLSTLMQEYAMEKLTEETLNYLAYIHYYLTGTMGDNPPGDLMMFKSKEYKACLEQTLLSSIEDAQSAGGGVANHDNFEFLGGLDVPQLLKKAYCSFKFTGVDVGVEERERFNKSKAFVRAIFYKLLNGSLDFQLSQSEQCREFENVVRGISELADKVQQEGMQRCVNGDSKGMDGTKKDCAVNIKEVRTLGESSGASGSINPESVTDKSQLAESNITNPGELSQSGSDKSGDTGILKAGPQKSKARFDFASKIIFTPSSLFMDRVDLSIDERYSLYSTTLSSFIDSIKDSTLYSQMTTPSRDESIDIIEKIITIQQLNHKNLKKLECSINKDKCDNYSYITEPEYNRVVKHGGQVNECLDTDTVLGSEVCVKKKAYEDVMYRGFDSAIPVGNEKRREYMNKLVETTMFYYVMEYLKTNYGLVFKEDHNTLGNNPDGTPMGAGKVDYLRIKLKLLRLASRISKYWTSPIASVEQNESLKQDLRDLELMSKTGESLDRKKFIKIVERIMKNDNHGLGKEAMSISFSPYIYEPINELQLAKVLYYLSDSLNIRKISGDVALTELSISIPGFFDYTNQYGPILNQLESRKIKNSPNYATSGAVSPFKPIKINDVLINQFLYQKISSSRNRLSLEEFNNVVRMVDSFKDFYIKRLLDAYKEKYKKVSGMAIDILKETKSPNATTVKDLEYEIKKLSFRMLQRREMLKLLINE